MGEWGRWRKTGMSWECQNVSIGNGRKGKVWADGSNVLDQTRLRVLRVRSRRVG